MNQTHWLTGGRTETFFQFACNLDYAYGIKSLAHLSLWNLLKRRLFMEQLILSSVSSFLFDFVLPPLI